MHHVELTINIPAAVRAISLSHTAAHDDDLAIKTTLTEALGGSAVRPWSILRQRGPDITIVGYSALDAGALRERLALATPALQSAISNITSASIAVRAGSTVRFSVQLSPTVNVTRGGERDVFLTSPSGSNRGQVYADYLTNRLRGATLSVVQMTRFRLEKITRPHRGDKAPPSGWASRIVPDTVLEGVLTVDDATVFAETLASGVGRQRAYGRGFIRLEPLTLERAA